ncbi:MAG: hypothetical protein U9O63_04290, partial [Actinomycetota bacterium]|nr:hypothetical protein [Actinomycetota bacterium]
VRGDTAEAEETREPFSAAPEPEPVATVDSLPPIADVDPFALRERVLLPTQNRVLRDIKRQLVDLQNQALGGLRADDEWSAGAKFFATPFRADLALLANESTAAGIAAASELIGDRGVFSAEDVRSEDPTDDFVEALSESVDTALRRSREAEAGSRETASAVSRVFRAWRTDEAERRVRASSFAAYHRGLVAALSEGGITRISAVSAGHGCPECPAGRGPWEISAGPPSGTKMPPARVDCMCGVIPTP